MIVDRLRAFGLFWWDFVVGDDWRIALGVVAALGLTAALAQGGVVAWWLLPLVALGTLAGSVWSSARAALPPPPDAPAPR